MSSQSIAKFLAFAILFGCGGAEVGNPWISRIDTLLDKADNVLNENPQNIINPNQVNVAGIIREKICALVNQNRLPENRLVSCVEKFDLVDSLKSYLIPPDAIDLTTPIYYEDFGSIYTRESNSELIVPDIHQTSCLNNLDLIKPEVLISYNLVIDSGFFDSIEVLRFFEAELSSCKEIYRLPLP